jgi:hypothetical protein
MAGGNKMIIQIVVTIGLFAVAVLLWSVVWQMNKQTASGA